MLFAGVAVGAGLQSIVAVLNLCCYYVIGIPIGILLAYVADLEVKVINVLITYVLNLGLHRFSDFGCVGSAD